MKGKNKDMSLVMVLEVYLFYLSTLDWSDRENAALAGWNKPEHDPENKRPCYRFIILCISYFGI